MTTGGFILLLVLLTIGALVFIEIAGMPGRDARKRNHPNAEAINLLGYLGLPLGGAGWLVAMVWARLGHFRIDLTDIPNVESAENKADEE